ncbi:MAG: hypothetical protein CL728_05265 [Chloroflexi bacterium]|nr:hypothetical protein [Chloroflexota bacterium]|tara:strand:+ start:1365 stop:1688 length:324 start_codon:yes stop_codon:yes gene_type:complete
MKQPEETRVLGRVIAHRRSDNLSEKFVTRFSNTPDIDFLTWVKSKDDELVIWIAKPRKWFGSETKTPPFVFIISTYTKGYMNTTSVSTTPYSNEIFEQENVLSFVVL